MGNRLLVKGYLLSGKADSGRRRTVDSGRRTVGQSDRRTVGRPTGRLTGGIDNRRFSLLSSPFHMSILIWILTFVLLLVAVFLILVVLAQKSKDGGMGSALGGGMTESAFGAETGNVLFNATRNATIAFFVLAFGLYLCHIYQRKHVGARRRWSAQYPRARRRLFCSRGKGCCARVDRPVGEPARRAGSRRRHSAGRAQRPRAQEVVILS
jgi:protein translocase SecG subunit